ncbi:MAG: hypothetical protein H7144_07490 [Burkholderiales bacterium]|nr:hypothetical protein [Phycisphaerae bacterium]
MLRILASLLSVVVLAGCSSDTAPSTTRTPVDAALFGPASMRLHPVFTQVHDWTGDGQADGVEAVIELQDQFGDPTKAAGRVIFELYTYRQLNPDPRGQRVAAPWDGRLDSMEDQRARWNRVNRAYIFQLALDTVRKDQDYVLAATFELAGGGRYFSTLILPGDRATPKPAGPAAITPTPITPAPIVPPGPIITTDEPASAPTTAHTPPPRADQP